MTVDMSFQSVRDWAEGQDKSNIVHKDEGKVSETCFFASYLKDTTDYAKAAVGYTIAVIYNGHENEEESEQIQLPLWVDKAIIRIDTLGNLRPLTAGEAILILDGLEDKGEE